VTSTQQGEAAVAEQRARVVELRKLIAPITDPKARLARRLARCVVNWSLPAAPH